MDLFRSTIIKILLLSLIVFLIACAPKQATSLTKTFPPLDFKADVYVLALGDKAPDDAIEIGTLKISDTGFSTNCGWDEVIEKAKIQARKAGGNIVKITGFKPGSAMGSSSCDRIIARILKLDNEEKLIKIKNRETAIVDSTWNYAKFYVYRTGGVGALIGFDVHLGDSVICRAKSNSKYELVITKKGMNSIWAKTETKSEIPIDVQFGREYYIKCSLGMGVMIGHPHLQIVGRARGKTEFNSIKSK